MKARTPSGPDLAVKNVTLHSQGRREYGVLELFSHHLVFRYSPKNSHAESSSGSHTAQRRPEKKLHIAYPLINYCLLRPSHSATSTARQYDTRQSLDRSVDNEESLFPPTYGTGSSTPPRDTTRPDTRSPPKDINPVVGDDFDASKTSLSSRQPAIRMRTKDFKFMAFHFHHNSDSKSPDDAARSIFYALRSRCCITKIENIYAFHFDTPKEEANQQESILYDARREFARMGIGGKAAEGPGSAWRISEINKDYSFSSTYPSVLCVPKAVSDNMLKYGGPFRSRSRIPSLDYLHSNGGSITRSSQPMVGLSGKRNPQDERLVSAIFATQNPKAASDESPVVLPVNLSETVPTEPEAGVSENAFDFQPTNGEAVDETAQLAQKKIYGSTRQNYIVDARPRVNALANKATGGGIEDITNYMDNTKTPIEKVFLNIANIHVMRSSLDKVVESMASSDYLDMKPNQEYLRKSGWLGHIAGLMEGAELTARVVGLGGSHVLVHCSDGWDRTAQVSALAQVMLDPFCRTLNGFITLVQKDFLSYGHKFRHRNGLEGSEKWFEIENEKILPARSQQGSGADANGLNSFGAKAFSGAKSWFQNNRNSIFKQQNVSRDSLSEDAGSRPASPPLPNSLLHSPPDTADKRDHKMDEKEVSPIFHQFLDAVYQLLCQNPDVFEFNERFLRRLFYQVYAGQYGEFLFNNEQERSKHEGKTTSVWAHFLARRTEMINTNHVPKISDPLLFPARSGPERAVEVRWWAELFGRKDEDMNAPRFETTDFTQGLQNDIQVTSADDTALESTSKGNDLVPEIREAKSTPNLNSTKDPFTSAFSSLNMRASSSSQAASKEATTVASRPPLSSQETDLEVLAKYRAPNDVGVTDVEASKVGNTPEMALEVEETTDSKERTSYSKAPGRSLDFAAFASQNAFSDR